MIETKRAPVARPLIHLAPDSWIPEIMEHIAAPLVGDDTAGPVYWMRRVTEACERARHDFDPEPVHDLRVALRRCSSIADVMMAFDPHPAWRQMKLEARRLFERLGALRDTQVMKEWLLRLAPADESVATSLTDYLSDREAPLRATALEALKDFDQKAWSVWTRQLAKRAPHIPPDGMAFQHLALERLAKAHERHRQARRNRSHAAYHRLRIGLKKFRYVVENFLPSRHELWGGALRALQDLLGEMHDLHVLWQTALGRKIFRNQEIHAQWRLMIGEEIRQRRERYQQFMTGRESPWSTWRSGLPGPDQLSLAVLARLRTWASFRDPGFALSEHTTRYALQLYDGLDSLDLLRNVQIPNARFMLEAAAIARNVGVSRGRKKHHVAAYRMIRDLKPSAGLDPETLEKIALIVRFHRGALPGSNKKCLARMAPAQRKAIIQLCGILRLATAFGCMPQHRIHKLDLRKSAEAVYIEAPGYDGTDPYAEQLAAARHLLETACQLPILICPS
jgi:CHAD domain-containing protein